jgi:hypothetical protein
MKKLLLMSLLLLAAVAHAQKLPFLIDINAGYSKSTVNAEGETSENGRSLAMKFKGGSGMYFGAGIGTRGTRRPGFRLGASFQRYKVTTSTTTVDDGQFGHIEITKRTWEFIQYLQATPCVFFAPSFSGIRLLASLGVPVNMNLTSGYTMFAAAELKGGVGYKGIMLTAAYQLGLNNNVSRHVFDPHIGLYMDVKGKTDVLNVGLVITPQLF